MYQRAKDPSGATVALAIAVSIVAIAIVTWVIVAGIPRATIPDWPTARAPAEGAPAIQPTVPTCEVTPFSSRLLVRCNDAVVGFWGVGPEGVALARRNCESEASKGRWACATAPRGRSSSPRCPAARTARCSGASTRTAQGECRAAAARASLRRWRTSRRGCGRATQRVSWGCLVRASARSESRIPIERLKRVEAVESFVTQGAWGGLARSRDERGACVPVELELGKPRGPAAWTNARCAVSARPSSSSLFARTARREAARGRAAGVRAPRCRSRRGARGRGRRS